MITLELSNQDVADIAEALDDPATSEQHKTKLLVIRMHHEQARHGFIAKVLNLHANTITNYLKEYRAGGLAATLENRYYRPGSSLEPFMECLKCSFRAAPPADAKQAVARVEALTAIRLSESQARRFMKSLGMKVPKAASIPGKADGQLQFDFYTAEMLPRLEEAGRAERKLFFVDAAHFVLGAFLGMIWCFARVFVKTSPGGQVSLVMDNARYQRCRLVMEQASELGIELLFLPPYSPNLNLIERLWKLTKRRCLTNRYYPDFQSFRAAIDKCLNDLSGPLKEELASLMNLNFQFFQNHKS